jgi:hypothetical protein
VKMLCFFGGSFEFGQTFFLKPISSLLRGYSKGKVVPESRYSLAWKF